MKLQVQDVSWEVDGRSIIQDVEMHASDGEFIGVVGPNGSGKSTLLRCVYRALKPAAGFISLDDEDINRELIEIPLGTRDPGGTSPGRLLRTSVSYWMFPKDEQQRMSGLLGF